MAGWGNWLYDTEDVLPEAEFGVKGGIQMIYLSGNTPWNETFKYGPLAGAFFGVHRKMVGGRIEANVRRVKYTSNASSAHAEIVNFDLPVLFELRPIKEIKVHLGAQFTAYPIVRSSGKDIARWFAGQEVSGVLGLEGDLPLRITVGVKLIKGFTNLNEYNSKQGKWSTSSAQFYIGYRIVD